MSGVESKSSSLDLSDLEQSFKSLSAQDDLQPTSGLVTPMLTDLYQITMAYGYWMAGRTEDESVFDLFFRNPPFKGEFTIFAGLEEVIRYVNAFKFTEADINMLKKRFPEWDPEFFTWLAALDTSKVRIYAMDEGTVVFPRIPLIRFEGPLAVCQLLETTSLVLVGYASLVATNAARHRLAVGPNKKLIEFGLRRAQGPDGGVSAARYAFLGGFDGTSNVRAGMEFDIPLSGTHAHAFVSAFASLDDLKSKMVKDKQGKEHDIVALALKYRKALNKEATNDGELAAFIAYAQAFPSSFLALVDTYETLSSGVWNFVLVSLALYEIGYMPVGIRLDSGDLAYLSREARKIFIEVSEKFDVPFSKLTIVASNDISEQILWSLKQQGHEIDAFGVGTHLVTCKNQPALGCVFKLVQVNGSPRIKLSQDVAKVTIPGRKEAYRLLNHEGKPILDLMVEVGQPAPVPQQKILCRHPFDANKRCNVTPTQVVPLHSCVWDGKLTRPLPSLIDIRKRVYEQVASLREDIVRHLNPTPYKVSMTAELYSFMHELWLNESPIPDLE